MSSDRPAVVIDNGTGFTKMGYGSNVEPDYIVPTAIATSASEKGSPDMGMMEALRSTSRSLTVSEFTAESDTKFQLSLIGTSIRCRKAAGSSLVNKLTNCLALDAIKIAGIQVRESAADMLAMKSCLVMP